MPKKIVSPDELVYRRKLGRLVVSLRGMAGNMSQATLAEAVDRSEAAVSRWEGGKATPSAYDLRRIATAITAVAGVGLDRADVVGLLLDPPEPAVKTDPMVAQILNLAELRRSRVPMPLSDQERAVADRVTRVVAHEVIDRDRTRERAAQPTPLRPRPRPARAK